MHLLVPAIVAALVTTAAVSVTTNVVPTSEFPAVRAPASGFAAARFPAAGFPAAGFPAARFPIAGFSAARFPASRFPAARHSAAPVPQTPVLAGRVLATGFPAAGIARGEPTAALSGSSPGISQRGDRGFTWPLPPRPVIMRTFEQPRDQWSAGHRGVDFLASAGQPVLSAGDGVVAFSGEIAGRGVITIRHAGGLRTSYEPVDDRLKSATLVHLGQRIGVIGAVAGHCVPLTCLHWGAITGTSYLDPLSLLGFGRPILLPLG